MRHAAMALAALLGMIGLVCPARGSITYTVALTAPSGTFTFTDCIPTPFGQQCTTETIDLGSESLTGSIVTDATLGALAPENLTGWAISGAGAISFNVFSDSSSFFGSPPGSLVCGVSGCGVTATATELDFTGDSSSSLTFENQFSAGLFDPISTIDELSFASGAFTVLVEDMTGFPTAGIFQMPTANYAIATSGQPTDASVPEPGSLALIALPLALLVRAQYRSRNAK
jgi:hypothetical protein